MSAQAQWHAGICLRPQRLAPSIPAQARAALLQRQRHRSDFAGHQLCNSKSCQQHSRNLRGLVRAAADGTQYIEDTAFRIERVRNWTCRNTHFLPRLILAAHVFVALSGQPAKCKVLNCVLPPLTLLCSADLIRQGLDASGSLLAGFRLRCLFSASARDFFRGYCADLWLSLHPVGLCLAICTAGASALQDHSAGHFLAGKPDDRHSKAGKHMSLLVYLVAVRLQGHTPVLIPLRWTC